MGSSIACMDNLNNKENADVVEFEQRPSINYPRRHSRSSRRNSKLSEDIVLKHDERQYLDLINQILLQGDIRSDRVGNNSCSIFGAQSRYNLQDDIFPLLTTKRVAFRTVLEELLWFIRGSTNAKELSAKGVKLWEGNSSRQVLDGLGFTQREEGDLGPFFGFQWRHFGANYIDMNSDYTGQGIDQLTDLIKRIKEKPNDRRLLLVSWNPVDLPKMSFLPHHCLVQFYVSGGYLSSQLYQRSADMVLRAPSNIATYCLLTYMIAHVTGLKPKEFIYTLGEAHVDNSQSENLRVQIQRKPRPFPKLFIKRQVNDIEQFLAEDFELLDYDPHPSVRTSINL